MSNPELTTEQAKLLNAGVAVCRYSAERVGPLHGAWDFIFEAEALLGIRESSGRLDLDRALSIAKDVTTNKNKYGFKAEATP